MRVDGPLARGFLRFLGLTALRAEGCGIALSGDEYEVSVTGFTFSVIWHDRHSADWLTALASPYPAAPDFHLKVKRLTMICASLALLHPLLSLTHWIFRSLMLPYKSSSHSANHVCCASLRSGSKETRKLAAFPMDMQGFETSTHRKLSL